MSEIPEVKIKEVQFLTPARVLTESGAELVFSIDVINRRAYAENGLYHEGWSELIFAHLDEVNTLPEDFFQAPDEVVEQAVRAQGEHESLKQQIDREL